MLHNPREGKSCCVPVLSLLAMESTVVWSREEGVGEGVPRILEWVWLLLNTYRVKIV